jgi:hypothetical protein
MNFAQHIAGAVLLTAELFYGPLITRGEEELAFELPRDRHLSRREMVSASQLAEAAISHGMTAGWHNFLTQEISSCCFIPDEVFSVAWVLAIHPLDQCWPYQAMVFYSASIRGFFPSPSQLKEAINCGVPIATGKVDTCPPGAIRCAPPDQRALPRIHRVRRPQSVNRWISRLPKCIDRTDGPNRCSHDGKAGTDKSW